VIAVRADPAEAPPSAQVALRALVATPLGAVDDAPLDWQLCLAPRGPDESTSVAALCLTSATLPDGTAALVPVAGSGHLAITATVPADACARVGPQAPRGIGDAGSQRPPDPDATGGYQLPVRIALGDAVAFARLRLRCDLPDVGIDVAREYQARYRANQNPALDGLYQGDSALPRLGSGAASVVETRSVELVAAVAHDAAETYVLVDPDTRRLTERTEALEVAWFTNGGSFAHDRTTPGSNGRAANTLRIDAGRTEPVTVWLVLRDERGGTDSAVYALQPTGP
jgi:hypothetical protein